MSKLMVLAFLSMMALTPVDAKEAFVVSGLENTGFAASVIIWKYQNKVLVKKREIEIKQHTYTRMIELWRDRGLLGIWVDDLSTKQNKFEFILLNILEGIKVNRINLPAPPVFGGSIRLGKDSVEIITPSVEKVLVSKIKEQTKEVLNHDFQWDTVLINGSTLQRGASVNLFLVFEENGSLFYRFGSKKYKSNIALPEKFMSILPMINMNWGVVSINNPYVYMIGTMGVGEHEQQGINFIYYKKAGEWEYAWDEYPASSSRSFGTWVVTQVVVKRKEELQDENKSPRENRYVVSGTHHFHNVIDQRRLTTELKEDSEVFDIDDEGWVLYRAGATLYKAQIQKNHLSTPIKLITDPILRTVHWGLWAEDEEPVKAESLQPTQSNNENIWLFALLGVLLIGVTAYFVRRKRK